MKSGGARAEAAEEPCAAPAAAVPAGRPVPRRTRRYGRLRPGDRVAVVAPSGPAAPARLEAGCALLRDLGLDVVVGKHTLDRVNLGTPGPVRDDWHRLAGGDADRAADLQAAWCDPRVRAVICARGGYGATRVLDHLDWGALRAATEESIASGAGPAILHGSSDITALHVAFGTRLGITTSFGPMPAGALAGLDAAAPGETLDGLRAALFGGDPAPGGLTPPGGLTLPGARALRPGRAEGPLTGGTLSLLVALLGTPYAPPPAAGHVVFLEDVTEAPYRVDRMLVQLLQSGWFDGAAGVALGTWEDCGDAAELDSVFAARLGPLGVPVLAGVPVGHGPRQLTLELGAHAVLDVPGAPRSSVDPHPAVPDTGALTLQAPGGAR